MGTLPRNIYEQQAANRRNTILVMTLFVLFFGFLGFGFDYFILGFGSGPRGVGLFSFPIATIIAMFVGLAGAFWGLENGSATVLASSSAIPVEPSDPQYQQLVNVVDEMAIAAGLHPPRIFVIPDPDPNAFASGKDPEHASIAVTRGLLEKLNRDELQGVIAHEMSHVRNYDIRTMTVVAALIGAVMLISEFGLRSMQARGGRRRSLSSRIGGAGGAIFFVLWLIAMLLAPLLSQILAMAVSRQREYLADASGAELTRNPVALASALNKIDEAVEPTRSIKKGTAHLCIADPLGSDKNEREGFLADLFATHPPVSKRITYLKAMAYQHA